VTIWTHVVLLIGWNTGPEGNRLDMVAWVPGSSWASDPSHQGCNRCSEEVLLAGQRGATGAGGMGNGARVWLCLRHWGRWPQLCRWPDGVYVGQLLGGDRREMMRGRQRIAMGRGRRPVVRKYSSSACVNMHVASINRLSQRLVGGLGSGQRLQGLLWGWQPGRAPKHGQSCRRDSVCSISKREWIILLNGSIKVLGAPREGDAVGYPGGGSLMSGS